MHAHGGLPVPCDGPWATNVASNFFFSPLLWLVHQTPLEQAEEGKTSAESQAEFNAALSVLTTEAKALVQVRLACVC
jgi:hypothetical protein